MCRLHYEVLIRVCDLRILGFGKGRAVGRVLGRFGKSDRSEHGIPCSFVRDFPGLGKVIDFPRLGKSDRSEPGIPGSLVVDFPRSNS